MVLLMANVVPEWFGAMSTWLERWPAELQAQRPIENETRATARASSSTTQKIARKRPGPENRNLKFFHNFFSRYRRFYRRKCTTYSTK